MSSWSPLRARQDQRQRLQGGKDDEAGRAGKAGKVSKAAAVWQHQLVLERERHHGDHNLPDQRLGNIPRLLVGAHRVAAHVHRQTQNIVLPGAERTGDGKAGRQPHTRDLMQQQLDMRGQLRRSLLTWR